ncbi:uncharacterized protein LOC111519002 [Drosophila willistoni]|uniref:uncharacterized protein LOC111519002 n=1 Tax=Drosophila willistoni TaxID=7260 RepID=UPI001F077FB9|nr:uncharacterized protein LOC111519002 [Drosophila willistoni]
MTDSLNIINLPIEVLDLIYSFLNNVTDELNLSKAHDVLTNAFVYHNRKRFTTFNLNHFTLGQIEYILEFFGSNIRSIQCSMTMDTDAISRAISTLCPNLEFLELRLRNALSLERAVQALSCLQNIKGIEVSGLENIFFGISITNSSSQMRNLQKVSLKIRIPQDTLVHFFGNNQLQELRILYYEYNWVYHVDYIKLLSQLRRLHYNCKGNMFTAQAFLYSISLYTAQWEELVLLNVSDRRNLVLPYMPKLRHLSLSYDPYCLIGPNFFNRSVTRCAPYLEELSLEIWQPAHYDLLASMRMLKQLKCIVRNDSNCPEVIKNFAHLERLCFRGSLKPGFGLMPVITNCKKLRYLDIQGCEGVYNDFVFEMLPVLNANGVTSSDPLILLADYTGIDRNINKLLSCKLYGNAVKVQFGLQPFFKSHIFAN